MVSTKEGKQNRAPHVYMKHFYFFLNSLFFRHIKYNFNTFFVLRRYCYFIGPAFV